MSVRLAGPLRLCPLEQEFSCLLSDRLHLGNDLLQPAAVLGPLAVDLSLCLCEAAAHRPPGLVTAPLPVGAVRLWRVGVAATAGGAAEGVPLDDRALLDEAQVEDLASEHALSALELLESFGGGLHGTHGKEVFDLTAVC